MDLYSERSEWVDTAVVYFLNRSLLDLKRNAFTFLFLLGGRGEHQKQNKTKNFQANIRFKITSMQNNYCNLSSSWPQFYPVYSSQEVRVILLPWGNVSGSKYCITLSASALKVLARSMYIKLRTSQTSEKGTMEIFARLKA